MSLNATPSGERKKIVLLGARNAGKSSLMNRMINQDLSVVSPVKGTTTDPVRKAMELLPAGPVVMIDTPGLDDEGDLGELRVRKALSASENADAAVFVLDGSGEDIGHQAELVAGLGQKGIPSFFAVTHSDVIRDKDSLRSSLKERAGESSVFFVSSVTGEGVEELKNAIGRTLSSSDDESSLLSGLITQGDIAVLVIPIDKAAPKGRLILPQQQAIRSILDNKGVSIAVKETELESVLGILGRRVRMVITDSQIFRFVSAIVPDTIPLTSFSILMARYKGNLEEAVRGVAALKSFSGGERILISEGCTHHRQCGDIGTEKLPEWIRGFTGKDFIFEHTMGTEFPADLSPYSLIIHCGGCMLTEHEMKTRYTKAGESSVPITNYGIAIAYLTGILERSLGLFPDVQALLDC